ncbi:acyl-CoA thioester hydrolase/BAAT C-terminal domain-containing protein [Alteribacter keqinensis]|uniref:Uncharacterized protein n=1 Tax=Alteribacter keqinensis TaxID=2483800 RepID=A0A3M7TSI0_9BACI|nr:acyl-CoA thioester hydrolase/BAAT C-terminal domain-containing protein [Alteribacter keqinensis]RNA68467.1 hypothetical protein EBO34_00375 [Alteribacter keqinensis]
MTCFLYPDIGRIDEPVQLHLDGLTPFETLEIKARWIDRTEKRWASAISVQADETGKIRLSKENGPDTLQALLWSLTPVESPSSVLQKSRLEPMNIDITVINEEKIVVLERTITRLFQEDHIQWEEVDEPGLNGVFFYPENESNVPAVIILGGSEGGIYEETAAVLSAHGYAVFALAYFGAPSLPATLHEVPLEVVGRAVEWLSGKDFINREEIGCMGTSKGGELALLAASYYPQIRAVVGEVPASHAFQSVNRKRKGSSWTYGGKSLPYVKYSFSFSITLESLKSQWRKKPVALRGMFERSLEKSGEEAAIPVEKINGPVLLLSGEKDRLWPSTPMCETIMARLAEHSFPFEKKHVSFKDAGHVLTLPYLPSVLPADLPFELGGDERANALAGLESWTEILSFFERHFHPVKPRVESVLFQP